MKYDIKKIASIIGAPYKQAVSDYGISVLLTDSRSLTFPEETLFFAIKTERTDASRFIPRLYSCGVRNFVAESYSSEWDGMTDTNIFIVPDVVVALQQIAAEHRRRFSVPVVGITGSNGKTVVKEWLYQLLREEYTIARSPRSYNSQTGVPLSVWGIEPDTELAIMEAGISQPGEMERIAKVIAPTTGVFTHIGDAHQENFTTFEEKILEKLKLFETADTVIYNADEEEAAAAITKYCKGKHLAGWSKHDPSAPVYVSQIEKKSSSTHIDIQYSGETISFEIPFIEEASIVNAIHCATAALLLGISPAKLSRRMMQLEPVAMRLEVKEGKNGCTIINDTYNSDINSLAIALDFLSRRDTSKEMPRRVILSDILQSASDDARLYTRVAEMLTRCGVAHFVGIGARLCANRRLFPEGSEFYTTTREYMASGSIERYSGELILVKGARRFMFDEISEALSLKRHETILEINLDALLANYNHYKQKLSRPTRMICMVKAFGYGAGSYELAKTLQDAGCDYLAVAVADEGAELRKAGITMPIMVMNPEMSAFDTLFRYNLEPEVYSFRLLRALSRAAEAQGITKFPVHIKIDSGMHRLGFTPSDMPELIRQLSRGTALLPRSVFSHLAGSDDTAFDAFTMQQIERFTRCAAELQRSIPSPIFRHILNTAGISRFTQYQYEGVRLGIGLYGVAPYDGETGLKCVSSLKSTILQIKELTPEETVGYGRKGKLSRPSRIAAVPIGYADGLDRHLGNRKGEMFVNGKRAPIVGNICMDVTMIDVTDIECAEGDTVEIFGNNIRVEELAGKLGTIPYEILTSVSSRVKRVYYRE